MLEDAGRALLGAVTGGQSWVEPLEAMMPHLGCFGGGLARVSPPRLFGLPTSGLTEVVAAIGAGKAPPLSKLTRIDPEPQEAFVCDQMDLYRSRREHDPFCLDFIRPSGLAYQASAFVDGSGDDVVNFVLFRGPGSGGFDPNELHAFRAFLPYVRAAAMASRASLRIEAERSAAPFAERGDSVLHVAFDGTIRDRSAASFEGLAPDVTVRGGRLTVSAPGFQRKVDRALTTAVLNRRPSLVTIATEAATSLRLLILPVLGQALDVFHATAALVVALDITSPPRIDERSLDLLATASGLTRRETEVARLVVSGQTPRKSADVLDISYETARLHLRNAYAKLGVHGQVELVTLVNRLSSH